jgi:hypothetical protein
MNIEDNNAFERGKSHVIDEKFDAINHGLFPPLSSKS